MFMKTEVEKNNPIQQMVCSFCYKQMIDSLSSVCIVCWKFSRECDYGLNGAEKCQYVFFKIYVKRWGVYVFQHMYSYMFLWYIEYRYSISIDCKPNQKNANFWKYCCLSLQMSCFDYLLQTLLSGLQDCNETFTCVFLGILK